MRLFNDYISLICSKDRLSVSLEKLLPISPKGPVTFEMIQGFLESKKVHHVNWDIVKSSLENCVIEEDIKEKRIVELQQASILSDIYGSFHNEDEANKWLNSMNMATTSWLNGEYSKEAMVSFYIKGDVILELEAPAETDCFGESVKAWNPTKWLMFEDGIEEKITAKGTALIAKYNGYLVSEKNIIRLQKVEILSDDEMVRYALILKPSQSKNQWEKLIGETEKRYDVHFEDEKYGLVELERGVQAKSAESGSIEQHVLNNGAWYEEVYQGQTLFTILPGKEAKLGLTVTKKRIEPLNAKADKLSVSYGDGVVVEVDDEGHQHYRAKIDGVVQKKGHEISVQEVLSISKNLSVYKSPIYYNGPVEVQGDILEGVYIQCHDLVVNGMVENNVNIIAKYGVEIDGGVIGAQTTINSETFICHHIQDALIKSSGDIQVSSYSYRANLYSGKSIIIKGEMLPKDHQSLVGGVANAFDHIEAHSIGSKMCTTVCAVGLDLELWEKCEKSKEMSRKLYKDIQEINKKIPIDLIKSKDKSELTKKEQEYIAELLIDLKSSMRKREMLMDQLNEDKPRCLNINKKEVYLSWKKSLKPDVIVMVGDIERQLRSSINQSTKVREVDQRMKLEAISEK